LLSIYIKHHFLPSDAMLARYMP